MQKILLIKLWAIGEVALATPCISKLKTRFPDADLYFLVGDNAKDIVIGNADIKKVFSVDEDIFLRPDLIKLITLIRDLKKERFDAIVLLHYSSAFSLFAFLVGAPERIGLGRPGSWSLNTANVISNGITSPRVFEYLKVLELLSISKATDEDAKIAIFPNDEDEVHVKSLMEENNLKPKKFIIIAPTGGENPAASKFDLNIKNKVWPLEHYKEFCNLLLKNSAFKVVIIGKDAERSRAAYIKSGNRGRIVDLCGKTNLRELVLLAERACLSITNDSGPMFLLSSSGSPSIAIFGPTDPDLVCTGLKNIIVMREKMDCSPCSYDSTTPDRIRDCEDAVCVKRITPEKVFQKVCEILKLDSRKFSESYL